MPNKTRPDTLKESGYKAHTVPNQKPLKPKVGKTLKEKMEHKKTRILRKGKTKLHVDK